MIAILKVPCDAWATLVETLEMDSTSGSFSPKLRGDISTALEQVEYIREDATADIQVLVLEAVLSEFLADLLTGHLEADVMNGLEIEGKPAAQILEILDPERWERIRQESTERGQNG